MLAHLRLLFLSFVFVTFPAPPAFAQSAEQLPEAVIEASELERDIRFLASDELRGRAIGSSEINIAARYLAEQFRAMGLVELAGAAGYFQTVPLVQTSPPEFGVLIINGDTLHNASGLVALSELSADIEEEAVFVGHGIVDRDQGIDDYAGMVVNGKIVFASFGAPDGYAGPYSGFMPEVRKEKARLAAARGAVAFVEFMSADTNPGWQRYSAFLSHAGIQLAQAETPIPAFVAYDESGSYAILPTGNISTARLMSPGLSARSIQGLNVAALVEGADLELSDEYVVLVAHYDHVGVGAPVDADSIYNGARDNGMGTVALLAAAKSLAATPARRSVLLLAVTAEEVGLFGSRYYADHPLVPPAKTVFVLNTDGAGYTDTSLVTVIGLERTGAEAHIRSAASAFGLDVLSDPVPEQNLFNRSDNVPFARLGIPAPTLSPGFRAFDTSLMKYYHQPSDEIDPAFDFSYLHRYCATFARAARLIANDPKSPVWAEGDPYEQAARALYGN